MTPPQPCGTYAAYMYHFKHRELIDEPCQLAKNVYQNERRRLRGRMPRFDEIAIDRAVTGEAPDYLSVHERAEVVRRLHRINFPDTAIARRLHVDRRTVRRYRRVLGLPVIPADRRYTT